MAAPDAPAAQPKPWREQIAVHQACNLLPMLSHEEFLELADDIGKSGLVHPVVVWRGSDDAPEQLIDGRNRLDALATLPDGDVRIAEALRRPIHKGPDIDPYAYVVSVNIRRRHLTSEQKRDIIAKLLKLNPQRSDRAIAKNVGVDHKTVATERVKAEAGGEIPHVETRTDTKGRHQPATKPRAPKPPPASANTIIRPMTPENWLGGRTLASPAAPPSLPTAAQPAALRRDEAIIAVSRLLRAKLVPTLEDITALIRDEETQIKCLPRERRESIARAYLNALYVDANNLATLHVVPVSSPAPAETQQPDAPKAAPALTPQPEAAPAPPSAFDRREENRLLVKEMRARLKILGVKQKDLSAWCLGQNPHAHLSAPHLRNILNDRKRLTPVAAAVLRQWLADNPAPQAAPASTVLH
jgi:hypothetical protein